MATNITSNTSFLFSCENCNFRCSKKGDYTRHLHTRKHRLSTNSTEITSITSNHVCNICNKEYQDRSGLWRHMKTCKMKHKTVDADEVSSSEPVPQGRMVDASIVIELLKQNQEFKNMMVEQQQQLLEYQQKSDYRHDQLIEAVKDGKLGNTTNNTTHNKFNLNVFLNEKCKNAMTLTDFVNSMNLTIEDFIQTGERGFIEGISNIIIDRIHNMDLLDRPLHCTDLKRETVYIKDTHTWEKDEDMDKLRKAVKIVAHKNERMRPIWYEETPDVDVLGSENCEKFLKYSQSALGGCGREQTKQYEDKIIRNILKETVIDKTNQLL
jgi:hypothetical protein